MLFSPPFFGFHSYICSGGIVSCLHQVSFHPLICFGGIVLLLSPLIISKVEDRVSFRANPFNRSVVPFSQVLFALSSLASLFNRSAIRIYSSSFLFSNGVFSNLFISVVFFSRNGLTFFKVLWFHSFVKEAT